MNKLSKFVTIIGYSFIVSLLNIMLYNLSAYIYTCHFDYTKTNFFGMLIMIYGVGLFVLFVLANLIGYKKRFIFILIIGTVFILFLFKSHPLRIILIWGYFLISVLSMYLKQKIGNIP